MSTYPADLPDRFAAMAPDPIASDWLDVQRRFRATRKRHVMAYALAAAFAVVLVGCTAVFGPRIVSFADSEPSPPWVLDELTVNRAAYKDYDPNFPGFDERESRRIIDRAFAGGTIAVDLTPLRGGGFCFLVDRVSKISETTAGECLTPERLRTEQMGVLDLDGGSGTGGGLLGRHEGGAMALLGWVASAHADEVDLRYENGKIATLETFRVTEPIDTAFFLFDVPLRNESYPRRASELRAIDSRGKVIARRSILPTDPDEWTFPRYGPRAGMPHHGFPPAADDSRQRRLVFPSTDIRVWAAPATGGITCFIVHDRSGSGSDFCPHDDATRAMFALDQNAIASIGASSVLRGLTQPKVDQVELHFQDGARDVTVPQEGLVVYAIPERRYAPGRRLVSAILRDAEGRAIGRIAFDPTVRDRYPCEHPKSDVALGPEHCP